jgi:hypothetical protein
MAPWDTVVSLLVATDPFLSSGCTGRSSSEERGSSITGPVAGGTSPGFGPFPVMC